MRREKTASQMDMFGGLFSVTFTGEELRVLRRPIEGGQWGGNQRLADKFQSLERETPGRIEVTNAMIENAYRKAWKYGNGTWQKYFRVIHRAAKRAGWTPSETLKKEVQDNRREVMGRRAVAT